MSRTLKVYQYGNNAQDFDLPDGAYVRHEEAHHAITVYGGGGSNVIAGWADVTSFIVEHDTKESK